MRVICLVCVIALNVFAQGRSVAITVDDLPTAYDTSLLSAFANRQIPVTGFVIQKRVEDLGLPEGNAILRQWLTNGFDLGNHTYSHPDINQLSSEEIEEEIVRGEGGRRPGYFRFPMNHTGDTQAKHEAAAAFLQHRGYRLATCTIDNSDYVFNAAYLKMLAGNDERSTQRLRREYLAYTSAEIDYYASLNRQVLGYEPPQVMLLHSNRLNADFIEPLLALFEQKRYQFVSLDRAQSDAAYRTPETYITKYGPMWAYRWAKVKNVKVDGRLEPEPPPWITAYSR